jgi:hypothetical protein
MRALARRLLRPYLWALGGGLFVQGALTLAFLAFTAEAARWTHGVLNHDARHGTLHVVWGLAVVLLLRAGVGERGLARTAVAFGLFYVALAALGVAVHDPFGLRLGPGENAFHFLIGPSALILGGLALWARAAPAEAGPAPRPSEPQRRGSPRGRGGGRWSSTG